MGTVCRLFYSSSHHDVWLSNPITGVLTHKNRSQYDAILVGKNTILSDDPELTTRHVSGDDPLRIILDTHLTIPSSSKVLSDLRPTMIINQVKDDIFGTVSYVKVEDINDIDAILRAIYSKGITSVIIEGGSKVLNSFISSGLWHEAMVIQTKKLLKDGIKAPILSGNLLNKFSLQDDEILIMSNPNIN